MEKAKLLENGGYRINRKTILGWGFNHHNTKNEIVSEPSFIGSARTVLADRDADRVYQSMRGNCYCCLWAKTPAGWIRISWNVLDMLTIENFEDIGIKGKFLFGHVDIDKNGEESY